MRVRQLRMEGALPSGTHTPIQVSPTVSLRWLFFPLKGTLRWLSALPNFWPSSSAECYARLERLLLVKYQVLCWFWVHSYLRKTWRSLLLCQSQHSWIDRLLVWLSSSTTVVCLVLVHLSQLKCSMIVWCVKREIRLRILVTSLLMDTISIRYGFSPTDERIKGQF